jgi:hypothetical protein
VCDFENPDRADDFATPVGNSIAGSPPLPSPPTLHVPPKPAPILQSPISKPATPFMVQPQLPPMRDTPPRPVDRLLELRLLHQFTTATAKTLLTNSPTTEDIWQRAVPQMGFTGKKTYLVDAILAVAALHLRSEIPGDKAVVRACHAYAASALAEYCAALDEGITADNAEALFLTASLIAFQATASRIFAKDDDDADSSTVSGRYELPLPWFHAFQGVKTVVASSWQWIRYSDIVKAVIDTQPTFQLNLNTLGGESFFGHLLEDLEEELASENARLIAFTSHAYAHAVAVLNWSHKNPHPVASLAFPATVSRRFIELVELKRPRALAILACFFALLKRTDDIWWLQDVSRREVMGLMGMFEPGSKWWTHIEWPIRIALWDRGPIPPEVWGVDWEKEPQIETRSPSRTMMTHIEMLAQILNQSHAPPPVSIPSDLPLAADSPD